MTGKPFAIDKTEVAPSQMTRLQTISDFFVFIALSAAYIIQSIYYTILGWPEKDLNNELCVVTGGGGGLGRLLAMRLSRVGVKVILWDINQEALDESVKIVESLGGWCRGQVVDISRREEVYKAAAEIKNNFGDVTLLFNNAGVVSGRALLDTPDHLIERSFSVNTLSHFWTVKAFLPTMLEKDHGHIVSIASMAGHVGIPKLIDYCSSKFAAVGFDEALRLELEMLGADGVHTTVICPYFIQATGMFEDVNSRWVNTLNSNDVADRIIEAVRKNERFKLIPWWFSFLLAVKWVVPWGCTSGFLRRLVPDANPQHHLAQGSPSIAKTEAMNGHAKNTNNNSSKDSILIQRMTATAFGERVL
jgi:all-trans-retinol dehydrogenase (NAD+)